ncbi:MAG TPA: sodium:proton exchanger [Dehalococcoidia bacterium]|nr:sodium:proton exchanger [Dehalococcoidia bacterium]
MAGFDPIVNIVIVLAAALVGGMVAHRLRQPVILGYLLVGVALGPHGFGIVSDLELIETLATIGVALLMFTVGLEISYSQLWEVGRVGIWGGIAQISATFALGMAAGWLIFDWTLSDATFFGLIISLSSTMVGLKLLMERGELDSVHGRIMVAILIVQDLSVVLMMVVVPVFGATPQVLLTSLAVSLGKAVLFLGVAIILGIWVLPWLLGTVAGVRSRELFLLTILILCFGAAIATYIFGLSIVFGAFVVGLLLRESRFAHQALAEVTPLRDVFATLFFVSLGMLLSLQFVVEHRTAVLLLVGVVLGLKFLICFGITRFFGYGGRVAVFVGAGLVQMGEFGFILAQAGMNAGIITEHIYSLVISSTVITMLLTPVLMGLVSVLYPRSLGIPPVRELLTGDSIVSEGLKSSQPENLVVLCGYGRVGRNVARSLRNLAIPYLIIEMDPERISELHREGEPCIYGDASNVHVLSLAGLDKASVLVITFPDPLATVTTAKTALKMNPKLQIIARVHRRREIELLDSLGVSGLVSPEYEASFEFVRHTLAGIGWNKAKIQQAINRLKHHKEEGELNPSEE